MRISLFEKKVLDVFFKTLSALFTVISFVFIFIPEPNVQTKETIILSLIVLVVIIYLLIYIYYLKLKKVKLKINNTEVNIFFGDIFSMPKMKVIAFNEYFDTLVDDIIISRHSLNGILIKNKHLSAHEIKKELSKNTTLRKNEFNKTRTSENKQKYELGQILQVKEFYLLSFTHFNEKNQAYLDANQYSNCLLEMWKNLNVNYAQNQISIPLLGDGITRIIDNKDVSKQELLEIMLTTLKISKQTFKEPSKINIVLYPGENNKNYKKFNFAKILYMFK